MNDEDSGSGTLTVNQAESVSLTAASNIISANLVRCFVQKNDIVQYYTAICPETKAFY